MDNRETKMEVHVYDGIEEHDHPIPIWFSVLFYGTVLFGMSYYSYYELWGGESLRTAYDRAVVERSRAELANREKTPLASESDLYALAKDHGKMESARGIFRSKCAACHGNQGQGGIGPNLTDAYFLHGGKIAAIRDTVANGVGDKGMPPWGPILSVEDVNLVSAYVHSLRGTRPAGAKAPQGALETDE